MLAPLVELTERETVLHAARDIADPGAGRGAVHLLD